MSETGQAPRSYRGFAAQALHYFQRPHESVRREATASPAAWRGAELRGREDWQAHFSADQIAELEAAVAAVRARGLELGAVGRGEFPLPGLGPVLADWARELAEGRGFLLARGLPVERWSAPDCELAFWGLGQHLGVPGAQNPAEELLGHVTDTGEERDDPHVRRYRTSGDIAYHCDLADVVGLLCLRAPREGGASRIVSSVSVYDELLARRPDLVERLYEPFCLDLRNEAGRSGRAWIPVPPCRYAEGRLRTFYHSDYFRSAVRHADVPPFNDAERELLDLYEAIASDPELFLEMQFAPGDLQLISNHTILHARTAYTDAPEPEHKRHLLRLWLSLDG